MPGLKNVQRRLIKIDNKYTEYNSEHCYFCEGWGDCYEHNHHQFTVNEILEQAGFSASERITWWETNHATSYVSLGCSPNFIWETARTEFTYNETLTSTYKSLRNRVACLARFELEKKNLATVKEKASAKPWLDQYVCCFCMALKSETEKCDAMKHTKATLNDVLLEKLIDVDELDWWWNTKLSINPYNDADPSTAMYMSPAEYWKSCNYFSLARWVRKITQ